MGASSDHSSRPRKTRTKAGCLTCRARKKKCDEVRPRCAGCRRNQLVCEWPDSDCRKAALPDLAIVVGRTVRASGSLPANKLLPAFPSVHMAEERACGLTADSTILLSHYFRETAAFFAMTPLKDNPFVTVFLPIGYMDDLLMHGMLALSGAHLTCKEPDNLPLATATQMHYLRLVNGLRVEFANLDELDLEKTERLLRILMVVCHYEAVSGDTQGIIFNHLRASRQLILSLLSQTPTDLIRHAISLDALGFSLELYTYLVICNTTLAPYGLNPARTIPLDDLLLTTLSESQSFPTFGSIFAGSHDLYRLIPEASQLAAQRIVEETSLHRSTSPSPSLLRTHAQLHHRLTTWTPPPPRPHESPQDYHSRLSTAEILRQALHIYLLCALAGSQPSTSTPADALDAHVTTLFSHALPLLTKTAATPHFVATLLWPVVVAGTVMTNPASRAALLREMRADAFAMRHLRLVGEVLQLLWDDEDPRAFGPYGLGLVMEKHGVNIVVA